MAADYRTKSNDNFDKKIPFYFLKKIQTGNEQIDLDEFLEFDIKEEKEIIEIYTRKYLKYFEENTIKELNEYSVNQVYLKIEKLKAALKPNINTWKQSYFEKIFKRQFPREAFDQLVSNKECYFCKIKESDFIDLYEHEQIRTKANRGFSFEVERLEPNQDYDPNNCVMACYWCNNAKTDEFSEEEFKPIGKAIGEVWKKRLSHK